MEIAIIDGDERYKYLKEFFENDGFKVTTKLTEFSDVYILPILINNESYNLNLVKEKSIVIAGKVSDNLKNELGNRNVTVVDFLDYEDFTIKNALATAEGAITIAMQKTPITIYQSKALVLGGGRIAKILASHLRNLGADVVVGLRNQIDTTILNTQNIKTKHLKDIDFSEKYDFIFNTVPANIISEENLRNIDKDTFLIELASKPYGFDTQKAKELGVNYEIASLLPGKTAPKSAGKFLYETIQNIIKEVNCD